MYVMYVLSRASQDDLVFSEGSHQYALLALRQTGHADAQRMRGSGQLYDSIQTAIEEARMKLLIAEKGYPQFDEEVIGPPFEYGYTSAQRLTSEILNARIPPTEALLATLNAERQQQEREQRISLSDFLPPPPAGRVVAPDLPAIPTVKGEGPSQPQDLSVELRTPPNAAVKASKDGTVVFAGPFRGYALMIVLAHSNNLFSIYSELGNIQVQERDVVKTGDIIGRGGILPGGETGFIFQVRLGGKQTAPQQLLGDQDLTAALTQ